jgi:hypothetical protein
VRLPILAVLVLLASPAFAVELFRYRGAAKDGGTLEYVFETDKTDVPSKATKEKVAEIAADFMTTFYGVQVGALETQELRTTPVPFWLVAFFQYHSGADQTDVLCRRAAERHGCRAQCGETTVDARGCFMAPIECYGQPFVGVGLIGATESFGPS